MRRSVILCGATSFIMAFLGAVLGFNLMAPSPASAQPGQPAEVRASAFTLVADDGTVLASLRPGVPRGNGVLTLTDAAGTLRLALNASGAIAVYDQDGVTPVFRAGRTFTAGPNGEPPINGVQLGPGGTVSMIEPQP